MAKLKLLTLWTETIWLTFGKCIEFAPMPIEHIFSHCSMIIWYVNLNTANKSYKKPYTHLWLSNSYRLPVNINLVCWNHEDKYPLHVFLRMLSSLFTRDEETMHETTYCLIAQSTERRGLYDIDRKNSFLIRAPPQPYKWISFESFK